MSLLNPGKYKAIYAAKLVEHLASGLTPESFPGVIDEHPEDVKKWLRESTSFKEAYDIGLSKLMLYWEKKLRDDPGNSTVAQLWAKNALNWKTGSDKVEDIKKEATEIVFDMNPVTKESLNEQQKNTPVDTASD